MGEQPKNKSVQNLLERQKNKKERKQVENPLIDSKKYDTQKNRSPEKPKEELQEALRETRKPVQIPKHLHKKIKRIAVTDDVSMYEVLERAVNLYEADRRR